MAEKESVKGLTLQAIFPKEALEVKDMFERARTYEKSLVGKEAKFDAYSMLEKLGFNEEIKSYWAKHEQDILTYEANKDNPISQKKQLMSERDNALAEAERLRAELAALKQGRK